MMKNIVIFTLINSNETAELLPNNCRVINLNVLNDDYKLDRNCDIIVVVRMRRLELPHREAPDPKFFCSHCGRFLLQHTKTTVNTLFACFYVQLFTNENLSKVILILDKSMQISDKLVKIIAELLPSSLSAVVRLFLCLFYLCKCLIMTSSKIPFLWFDLDTFISRNFNKGSN